MSEPELIPITDLSEENSKKFYAIRYSDYVHQYFGGQQPTLEAHLKWVNDSKSNDQYEGFGIILDDILIGGCSLKNISILNSNAEFDIFISKNYSGKGYGKLALNRLLSHGFNSLNLHRIYAFLIESNQNALRMYEEIGFKQEGMMREHVQKNNKYLNSIFIGILKEEYEYHN